MTYTCPMHPDVESGQPGRCPKCSMALVPKDGSEHMHHHGHDAGHDAAEDGDNYRPLIVITLLILAASAVAAWQGEDTLWVGFVQNVMTGFFLVFGTFKLMDLEGFVEGYATYDLLASRWRSYGYVYPLIEIFFGLSMLAGYMPQWLLVAEIAVMIFSGIGVAIKVAKRERFRCACLGTFLKVPLTTVTLIEDFGMAALAILLLFAGAH